MASPYRHNPRDTKGDSGSVKYTVVADDLGYMRLDPLPSAAELDAYYREHYYRAKKNAPDLKRMMAGGKGAERETEWLTRTLWGDVEMILSSRHQDNPHLLDYGCGLGVFAQFMAGHGWHAIGVEPSELARSSAPEGVLIVDSLESLPSVWTDSGIMFQAITLLNVLEHVRDPLNLLVALRKHMAKGGTIVVRVPNDFSEMQQAVVDKLGRFQKPYWVSVPDHINYFDFKTLEGLLFQAGFSTFEHMGDFPMEMFLLMGDDYLAHEHIGKECHAKRIEFELSLPHWLRRNMYSQLADAGIGRNALVFAELL